VTGSRWIPVAALAAAGLAGQALLQQPLHRSNLVRGARRLHAPPSSLAFRLASGGVKEAAGDVLWLTVLPKLGRPWADPARKAAWIESVTTVMTDANPRALYPLVYCAGFLEMIDKRHPAFERVLRHGIDIEKRGPFGRRTRPNADEWKIPMEIGMNLLMWGKKPGERERGLDWLRTAAEKPVCPGLVLDTISALRAKEGNDLEAWDIWLVRLGSRTGRGWQEYCLLEADRARLATLRKWAKAAEGTLGRWPATIDELIAAAPAATAADLARRPDRRAAFTDGVVLRGVTRDVEIPSLTERHRAAIEAEIREAVRCYEAEMGRRPPNLRDLELAYGRSFPAPLNVGTRWELDPQTAEPRVAFDPLLVK
jgi:hypothetical protein